MGKTRTSSHFPAQSEVSHVGLLVIPFYVCFIGHRDELVRPGERNGTEWNGMEWNGGHLLNYAVTQHNHEINESRGTGEGGEGRGAGPASVANAPGGTGRC